jgi:uncharacterized protein (DUF433 family)
MAIDRITFDPEVMAAKPCVRGMRIPVSVVLKMLAGGMSHEQILSDYPDLEAQDISECVDYAASPPDWV